MSAHQQRPEPLTIILRLELPPGVNKLYRPIRTKRGARMIKGDAAREWANRAQYDVRLQRCGVTLPYRFRALIVLPESAFDADAPTKELLDACQHGGAIVNDRYNRGYAVEIDETLPPGVVHIELTALPDLPPQKIAPKGKKAIENFSIPGI